MGAPYDNIPGVDSSDLFHPDIRLAMRNSPEFTGITPDAELPDRFKANTPLISDWDLATETGFYKSYNNLNAPATGTKWFIGWVEAHISVSSDKYITQTVHELVGDSSADTKVWRRSCENNVWGAWYKLQWSQVEQDARYKFPITELGTEDLNTILTSGDYSQQQNADATTAPNYPAGVAGFLQVRAFGSFVYQMYYTYQPDARFFWRAKYTTTWSAWKGGLSNVDNTSDVNKPVSTAQAAENAKLAKGLVYKSLVTGSSGSVTDAIINNIATFTFKANRNYRIVWDFSYFSTGNADSLFYCSINTAPTADAAANLANLTTIDGRTKGLITSYALGSTQHTGPINVLYNPGASDVTTQIKFRVVRVLGDDGLYVVANNNERAQYLIYDEGTAV